jgi:hypothetical protein
MEKQWEKKRIISTTRIEHEYVEILGIDMPK